MLAACSRTPETAEHSPSYLHASQPQASPSNAAPPSTSTDYDPLKVLVSASESKEVSIRDDRRGRDVLLTVRHPLTRSDHSAHPLIIFSHGAGGSGDAFQHLSTTLAARGYVVVHPWHSDSIALERRNGGPGFDTSRGLDQVVDRVNLPDRVADVRFIIENIDQIERSIGLEPGSIDPQRIGMAGHSAGAMTTQVAAGARFFPPRAGSRGIATPIDAIDAFALISPQGTTARSLSERSWLDCHRPMLTITGSRDVSRVSNETPESRRHPFEFGPTDGNKYLAFIDGATHSSFQGKQAQRVLQEDLPDNVDWIEHINTRLVVALMDAYVRHDTAAKAWLESDAILGIPGGSLEWKRK